MRGDAPLAQNTGFKRCRKHPATKITAIWNMFFGYLRCHLAHGRRQSRLHFHNNRDYRAACAAVT